MSSKGLALATSGTNLAAKAVIIIIAEYKPLNKTIISESLMLWIITEKTNQCRRAKAFPNSGIPTSKCRRND